MREVKDPLAIAPWIEPDATLRILGRIQRIVREGRFYQDDNNFDRAERSRPPVLPRAAAAQQASLGVDVRETRDGHLAVTRIGPGSPAERGGLELGDRIVSIDGRPIHTHSELVRSISQRGNRDVKVQVDRNGNAEELRIALGAPARRPLGAALRNSRQATGEYREENGDHGRYINHPPSRNRLNDVFDDDDGD